MQFITHTSTVEGAIQRIDFVLGADASGALWRPDGGTEPVALLLVALGGGQHVDTPGVAARAHRFAEHGYAVAALNNPGQGGRPQTDADISAIAAIRNPAATLQQRGTAIENYNAVVAPRALPEWAALLDVLAARYPEIAHKPIGFYGVSLGAVIGLHLLAAEPRITAARLGLIGGEHLLQAAQRIRVPVEFVMQWDDELISRESSLRLFDALGSTEKSLHASPGGHTDVPVHERDSALRFFDRTLRDAGAS
ncbi:MAG TPA: hypothetical protein VGL26_02530 [Jatrophihabitans sp.]|jgi:dienelactone hydrolase